MGSKKRLGLGVSSGVVLLLLAACSSNVSNRHLPAPRSQSTTGFSVAGLTVPQAKELESRGARLRELNQLHGIYEVYGIDSQTLFHVAPEALIEQNQYIEAATCEARKPAAANTNGGGAQYPRCDEIEMVTGIQISVESAGLEANTIVPRSNVDRVFEIKTAPVTKVLYKIVVLRAPGASEANNKSTLNTPLHLVTDDLGGYVVAALVNIPSSKLTCIVGTSFGVTENAPYKGPVASERNDSASKLTEFAHLGALQVDEAWKQATGKGVTIAVVDTGVNYNHPDLAANVRVNQKDPVNGIDDDKNGYIDDYVGWDFADGDAVPYDDQMHGTHVSGLATGAVGMAPDARLIPVKVLNAFGGGDVASIAAGIVYSVDAGANIINLSLGGGAGLSQRKLLTYAANYAEKKGALLVVAAGNECANIDQAPVYPAALNSPNILTVAATDNAGEMTNYSNFGAENVDIAAPGGTGEEPLLSAAYSNSKNTRYIRAAGTSMATPVTAGAAALVLSKNPALKPLLLKQILMRSAKPLSALQGKVKSAAFLNPTAAVAAAADPGLMLRLRGWWNSVTVR